MLDQNWHSSKPVIRMGWDEVSNIGFFPIFNFTEIIVVNFVASHIDFTHLFYREYYIFVNHVILSFNLVQIKLW